MKILAAILVTLAVLISVIPQFSDCESQGRMLTLQDGKQISMKCHWTARSELAVGIPLIIAGVGLFVSRRKETQIVLGILGAVCGVFTILLPTKLIGVCMTPEMICNSTMKPFLILSGSVVILVSIICIIYSVIKKGVIQDAKTQ